MTNGITSNKFPYVAVSIVTLVDVTCRKACCKYKPNVSGVASYRPYCPPLHPNVRLNERSSTVLRDWVEKNTFKYFVILVSEFIRQTLH